MAAPPSLSMSRRIMSIAILPARLVGACGGGAGSGCLGPAAGRLYPLVGGWSKRGDGRSPRSPEDRGWLEQRYNDPVTRRALLLALGVLLLSSVAAATRSATSPPVADELLAHVGALTAPEMEGRASGTAGGERAGRYL